MPWLVSFSILRPFGPSRETTMPRAGKTTTKGGAAGKKKATGAKASAKKSTGGGGGDGGGLPPDSGPRIVSALAALGLGFVWLSSRENQGTEINWQEFATVLLESGEVDRIIVTNSKVAEVLLRPNASVSLSKREEKTDELRDPYAWDSQQQPPQEQPKTRYPRIGSSGPQQAPSYHFAIGSVEIFERKLEAAQRQLGIEPRDFVPVQYVSETNWAAEGAKFLPTLLIIGAWLYVMRSVGGGGSGSGGGGMSNIFRIGQSKAKKIKKEDVNVTYADVAGCDEAKKEVMEFVEFLKEPDRFTKLGVRSRRPAVLRRLHAIDATRVHQTRSWVVYFLILRSFGPRRATAMLRAGQDSQGGLALRPARHGQDVASQGDGRRGERALLLHLRFGVRRDVRRRRAESRQRFVQGGAPEPALHDFY
jgi:hypothetical protein